MWWALPLLAITPFPASGMIAAHPVGSGMVVCAVLYTALKQKGPIVPHGGKSTGGRGGHTAGAIGAWQANFIAA